MRDDELDALVRGAEPQRVRVDDDELFAGAWARVQSGMDDGATRADDLQERRLAVLTDRKVAAGRRRGAARVASLTLAVALAGAGTAAAADFLSTRTGEELTGWEVEAGGSGEVLNMGGTDRAQVFDEVTAGIPFAPGYEAQRTYALEFFPRETVSSISEEHLRSWVSGNAVCTWADAWVAADDADDLPARTAAATVLGEAVTWPDIVEADESSSFITEAGEHLSFRWWVGPLAEAAATGDRAALLHTVARSSACSPEVIPVIDTAADYEYAGLR